MKTAYSLVLAIAFCFAPTLHAAPAAPAAPTSAPAPPHKVTIPPGFKVVGAKDRRAICEQPDEAWVTAALGKVQPTTRPTTMPAQLLAKLDQQRTPLLQQFAADLALTDLAGPAA